MIEAWLIRLLSKRDQLQLMEARTQIIPIQRRDPPLASTPCNPVCRLQARGFDGTRVVVVINDDFLEYDKELGV